MAYKPPKQTITDNDLKGTPSNEAVFEALKLKVDEPTISGTAGQLLQLDGYVSGEAVTSWVNPPSPGVTSVSATAPLASSGGSTPTISITQVAGDLDKVLVSNGTTASWQYAGLGAGSLGTNVVILGRSKPTSFAGTATVLTGTESGNALTSGSNQVYIGYQAGDTTTTGARNTCIGALSDMLAATSNDGVAIGYNARVTTGNIAIGSNAVADNSRNVSIGFTATTGANSDSIAIGNFAKCDGNYSIHIGAYSSLTAVTVSGANSFNGVNTVANSTLLGRSNELYFNSSQGFQKQFTPSLSEQVIYPAFYRTGGTSNDAVGALFTIAGSTGTGTGAGGDVRILTAPAGGVSNSTQNARVERVRVTSTGLVGVGTSTPIAQLHVSSQVQIGGTINAIPGNPGSMAFVSSDPSNNNTFRGVYFANSVDGCTMDLRKSRGTETVPVVVASGDRLGRISFRGNQDTTAGGVFNNSSYMQVIAEETFSSTARGSRIEFYTTAVGTTTISERLRIQSGSIVINEPGLDSDLRVEGDTDDNLVFVDASTDKVGIGTATPSEKLEVNGNIKGGTVSFNADSNRQATVTNLGFLTNTITHDFGSLSHGAEEEVTITVTGASVGDACFVGAPATIEIGLSWDAYVSAADTVKLRVYNYQNSNSIDPASATWRVTVLKS